MPIKAPSGPEPFLPAELERGLDRDARAPSPAPRSGSSRPAPRTARSRAWRRRRRRSPPLRAPWPPRRRATARSPCRSGSRRACPSARSAHRRPWPRDSRRCGSVRSTGTPWRVSARIVGVCLASSAISQHSAHSTEFGRAHHVEIGDGAERGQMLDRLMRRAVLAEADRVVRHDIDHALLHQRREADRRAAIIGEHEEGAAIGHDAAMQRDARSSPPPCRARARRNGCSCRRSRRA